MADSLTVQPKFSISQTEPDDRRPLLEALPPDETNKPEIKLPQPEPEKQSADGWVDANSLPVDQRAQVYAQAEPTAPQTEAPDPEGFVDPVIAFKGDPKGLAEITYATKGDVDLERWATDHEEEMKDPQIRATIADAMAMQQERGFKFADIKWGEAGKALAHLPLDIMKWGTRAADIITQEVAPSFLPALDPKSQAEYDKRRQADAAELVTGTNVGLEGLAGLIDKGAQKGTRKIKEFFGAKKPTERTAQEKLDFLDERIEAMKRKDLTARGHGVLTQTVLGGVMKDLEADGVKLDPESIATFASGDPVTFIAFGEGFKLVGKGGKVLGTATSRGQAISAMNKLRAAQQAASKAGADHAIALDAAGRAAEAEQAIARAAAGTVTPPIPGELPLVDASRTMTAGRATQGAFATAEQAGQRAAAAQGALSTAEQAAIDAGAAARGGPRLPGLAGHVARVADATANIADWSKKAAAKAVEFGVDKGLGIGAGAFGAGAKAAQFGSWALRGVAPGIVRNRALSAAPRFFGDIGDHALSRAGALLKGAPKKFGPYTQLASDAGKAALVDIPAGAAKGAQMDVALAAITNESPQDNAHSGIMMTALGLGHGGIFGGARIYRGQQFNQHHYGSVTPVRRLGNFTDLDAATELSLRTADKSADVESRLSAMREMFGPANVEMHLATDPAQFAEIVRRYLPGMTGEALDNARRAGGVNIPNVPIPGTGRTRNLAVFSELSAGEHEGVHGWQRAFSTEANRKLNQLARSEYAQEWEQIGRSYMSRIATPEQMARYTANGESWREALIDFTTGSTEWRNENWSEQRIIDEADNYIAGEVVADVGSSILQSQRGSIEKAAGFPGKLARILGATYEGMGINPFMGAETGQVGIPLKHGAREAIRKELINARRTIGERDVRARFDEPGAAGGTAPAPRPGAPGAPAPAAAEEAAEVAARAPATPGVAGGRNQNEIAQDLAVAIGEGTAVGVQYHHAPDAPAGSPVSSLQARRDIIELNRNAPNSVRPLWEQTFWPERLIRTQRGEIQVQGWTPEVFAANAHKLARALHERGATSEIPYEIDATTGNFTEAGWRELFADAADFSRNQIAGETGAGGLVVLPREATDRGFTQPPVEGAPGRDITQDRADVINMLLGLPPQRGTRATGAYPRNLVNAAIADATGAAGGLAQRTSPTGRQFAGENAELIGVAGREIREVNPLRARLNARNVRPSMIQAIQHLNLARISDVSPSPHAPLVKAREILAGAGFAPKSLLEKSDAKSWIEKLRAASGRNVGLTELARQTGLEGTPRDTLAQLRDESRAQFEKVRKESPKDVDEGMGEAMRSQFFDEAVKAADAVAEAKATGATTKEQFAEIEMKHGTGEILDKGAWLERLMNNEPTPSSFAPRTEAGREWEKRGFTIEHLGYPGFREIRVYDENGKGAAEITSAANDRDDMSRATVNGIFVERKYRKQGIAETLYRELFDQLREDGVSEVGGYIVNPNAVRGRENAVGGGSTRYYAGGREIPLTEALQEFSTTGVKPDGSDSRGFVLAETRLRADMKFAPSADPRAIKSAAIKMEDGKVFEGSAHFMARSKASNAGYTDAQLDSATDGFTTNNNQEFLNREEAFNRAVKLKQIDKDDYSSNESRYSGKDEPAHDLESVNFADSRKFAPRAGDPEARKVMEDYAKLNKLEYTSPKVEKIDPDTAREIADWYENAKHDPANPDVRGSYLMLERETKSQYRALVNAGYTIEPWKGEGEPYKSSADMQKDVAENKHLYFLKTEGNFAGDDNHPMLKPSGEDGLSVNDIFRAVHDFTHASTGSEFGPKGELNAWKAHSSAYSEEAQPALANETLAQNSWVNFGKHVTPEMKATDKPFAEQKAAVVPQELIDKANAQFAPKSDDEKVAVVHKSSQPGLKAVDPKYFGKGKATTTDLRGGNKSYFFVKGSKLGQDEPIFGDQAKLNTYEGEIPMAGLYDLRKGKDDPLGWRKTINREEADDIVKDAGYAGMILDTQDGRQVVAMFKSVKVKPSEPKPREIPSDEEITSALSVEKQPFVGAHRDIEPGTPVGLRIDIPAYARNGTYVITVHEKNEAGRVGKRIGYDSIATVDNPTFFSNESGAEKVRSGAPKFPLATVEGEFNPSRRLPRDIAEWTEVGFNPDRHSYFYDKSTDEPVVSGSRAISVGNSVYVKDAQFGDKADFAFAPKRRLPVEGEEGWLEPEAIKLLREIQDFVPGGEHALIGGSGHLQQTIANVLRNKGYIRMRDSGNDNVKKLWLTPKGERALSDREREASFAPKNQFKDESMPEELRKVSAGENFGQTFNSDGSVWTPGDKPVDIVTLASKNIPQKDLNKETFDEAVAPYSEILDNPDVKAGVFSFGKGGEAKVSIDINAVVPQEHRDNSVKFAKNNNQISIWDATKGEEVKTGGTGETVLTTPEAIKAAIDDLIAGNPVKFAPKKNQRGETEGLPGLDVPREYVKATRANMTQKELMERFPEAIVPRNFNPTTGKPLKIPSDIVGSPLYKKFKTEAERVKAFSDRLVSFAKEYKNRPEYDLGAKWYSDFTPALKKEFGKNAQKMAELLSATSPRANPRVNFGYAYDAMKSWEAGRFDKIIEKFGEGLEMLDNGGWEKYLEGKSGAHTPENALAQWVAEHDLQPRQTNGELYGAQSDTVLKVFARRWFNENRGPKTSNFVRNLIGESNEATIDMWADRTMRWAGYEGMQERWRILSENLEGVDEKHDYRFSEKVFRHAAERLKMQPSALQGALWFAEKARWADNGWARLDLGSYQDEMRRLPELKARYESNLKTQQTAPKGEQLGFDIQPRFK